MSKGPLYTQTQAQKDEDPILKILITALNVTDRPDLMNLSRKASKARLKSNQITSLKKWKATSKCDEEDDTFAQESLPSISSAEEEEEIPEVDAAQIALPTMLMAGTIWGEIFRADLSKNRVDVETNNLCAQTILSHLIYFECYHEKYYVP